MENYQKRILFFGKKTGQSRLFAIILILIAIYAFAEFIINTINIFVGSESVRLVSLLTVASTLCFSLALAYLAFVNLKKKKINSKTVVLLIWVAISWKLFMATMELYPWNILIALLFFLPGPLTLRKAQWDYISEDSKT
jgi:hypothetical protein